LIWLLLSWKEQFSRQGAKLAKEFQGVVEAPGAWALEPESGNCSHKDTKNTKKNRSLKALSRTPPR
jgi:hypothetical protein